MCLKVFPEALQTKGTANAPSKQLEEGREADH